MTLEIIALVIAVCIALIGTLFALMAAQPRETLEEQAECIRKDIEERERKKRHREMKRQRRRAKWQR